MQAAGAQPCYQITCPPATVLRCHREGAGKAWWWSQAQLGLGEGAGAASSGEAGCSGEEPLLLGLLLGAWRCCCCGEDGQIGELRWAWRRHQSNLDARTRTVQWAGLESCTFPHRST